MLTAKGPRLDFIKVYGFHIEGFGSGVAWFLGLEGSRGFGGSRDLTGKGSPGGAEDSWFCVLSFQFRVTRVDRVERFRYRGCMVSALKFMV